MEDAEMVAAFQFAMLLYTALCAALLIFTKAVVLGASFDMIYLWVTTNQYKIKLLYIICLTNYLRTFFHVP